MKNNGNTGAKATPKTVTYTFTFDNEVEARNFSLTELDPFIIVRYGTTGENFWEVHTYPYKLSEVLFPYYNGAARSYDNGFSWVVTVPYSKYRYPLEGIAIGEYKKDIITGAYQTNGHSFGEWVLNPNDAQDWFLYPADGAIY
jgi:LruC domain-containing protein